MKLKEVLTVIDSALVLELANEKETYESKTAVPEARMNQIVQSIQPSNGSLLIVLAAAPKAKTLEELGYSFESGM